MSDIVRLFLILLLLIAGFAAYFLVLNALFGSRVTRTMSIAQSMPGRSFGIGLVNFLFFTVIRAVLLFLAVLTLYFSRQKIGTVCFVLLLTRSFH